MKSHFLSYQRVISSRNTEPLADIMMEKAVFDSFKPQLFQLETFDSPGSLVTGIAAIFDLEGFTSFTSQSDPHLTVPGFVDRFVSWLFNTIRQQSVERTDDEKVFLYCPLPFYAKFLGDGILFLWEIDYKGIQSFCSSSRLDPKIEVQGDVGNIISVLFDTCRYYKINLYPEISKSYSRVPVRLRCGVAQGLVCSLGGGIDYVGPCINMAARLQKLGTLGLCILRRGIDLDLSPAKKLSDILICKKTKIRGTGEELIYIVREEFEKLDPEERLKFGEP